MTIFIKLKYCIIIKEQNILFIILRNINEICKIIYNYNIYYI